MPAAGRICALTDGPDAAQESRPRQLALDLPVEPRFGAEDFLVGPSNESAFAMLERWPDWPDRTTVLVGPASSGKSHLAAIWARRAHAHVLRPGDLTGAYLRAFAVGGAVVVEDADRAVLDEGALFHLLNLTSENRATALLVARDVPGSWGVKMPDLLSRLRRATLIDIGRPDDALIRMLLVKLFVDRQLMVDVTVVEYLLLRIERSFEAAARIVGELDREALASGRRITRAVAARVLDRVSAEGVA